MNQRVDPLHWNIPRPGETIAREYVIAGTCGRGRLAVVLSAVHARLGEAVAVKVLLPDWAGDAETTERFLRDARAARRIESEHAARVLDVGTLQSGAPYVVLEHVAGDSLQDVLAKWQPLPISTAVDWIVQTCEAIGEAHLHGIVHGELNPSNLVLSGRQSANGKVPFIKVIDFVLSKTSQAPKAGVSPRLSGPTEIVSSPHCMAPEQLRASYEADPRTDVWALGAVLYELLSGEPPFSGSTLPQVCAAVLTGAPRSLRSLRPEIPPELELVVARCLKKDRDARFASVPELAGALVPFGTTAARESVAQLERVVAARRGSGPRSPLSSLSLPPLSSLPLPPPSTPLLASDPRQSRQSLLTEDYVPHRRGPVSAKVVLVSLLMLTGVGALAFLGMYGSVHGSPMHIGGPTGVTAAQAINRQAAETEMVLSAIPPPPPAATVSAGEVTPPAPAPSPASLETPRTPNDATSGAAPNGGGGAVSAAPAGAVLGAASPSRAVRPAAVPRPAPRRAVVVHVSPRPTPAPPPAAGPAAGEVAPAAGEAAKESSVGTSPPSDGITGTPAAAASIAPPAGLGHDPGKTAPNPYEQQEAPAAPQAPSSVGDPRESQK